MKHAVIFGSPRSGTSILGEFFEEHPDYDYYFEPSIESIERRGIVVRWSEHRAWAMKNPIDLAGGDRTLAISRRTPGLPCNVARLEQAVPDARYVWIVRHPLDSICSLLPGMSQGWSHSPEPPEWAGITQPHMRAARLWAYMNGLGFEHLVATVGEERVLVVHYEDMVDDPKHIAGLLLAHVESDQTPPEVWLSRVTNDTSGYQAKHQDRWVTDDHDQHVGRWEGQLSDEQLEKILPMVGEAAHSFGYWGLM